MKQEKSIRVFIVDDHQMFIAGIRSMLENHKQIQVIGECTDGAKVMEALKEANADVVLLDINLPGIDGMELNQLIHSNFPSLKVIMLTMHQESSFIRNAVRSGAKGYILKNSNADLLQAAIVRVSEGDVWFGEDVKDALMKGIIPDQPKKPSIFEEIPKLSRREKEVLRLITQEFTTSEIGEKLFISQSTVETHRKNLLLKLNVRNTAGLVRFAIEKGLVD
jgi:DNA-binding NarL/FixJ family response regulator